MCIICDVQPSEINIKNITWCINVKKIPYIESLERLNCSYTNITDIPNLPNLISLNCQKTLVTKIPFLKKLKILNCSDTNIDYIPNEMYLVQLYCINTTINKNDLNIEYLNHFDNSKMEYPN